MSLPEEIALLYVAPPPKLPDARARVRGLKHNASGQIRWGEDHTIVDRHDRIMPADCGASIVAHLACRPGTPLVLLDTKAGDFRYSEVVRELTAAGGHLVSGVEIKTGPNSSAPEFFYTEHVVGAAIATRGNLKTVKIGDGPEPGKLTFFVAPPDGSGIVDLSSQSVSFAVPDAKTLLAKLSAEDFISLRTGMSDVAIMVRDDAFAFERMQDLIDRLPQAGAEPHRPYPLGHVGLVGMDGATPLRGATESPILALQGDKVVSFADFLKAKLT